MQTIGTNRSNPLRRLTRWLRATCEDGLTRVTTSIQGRQMLRELEKRGEGLDTLTKLVIR